MTEWWQLEFDNGHSFMYVGTRGAVYAVMQHNTSIISGVRLCVNDEKSSADNNSGADDKGHGHG